jgi:hypothetical protein
VEQFFLRSGPGHVKKLNSESHSGYLLSMRPYPKRATLMNHEITEHGETINDTRRNIPKNPSAALRAVS